MANVPRVGRGDAADLDTASPTVLATLRGLAAVYHSCGGEALQATDVNISS